MSFVQIAQKKNGQERMIVLEYFISDLHYGHENVLRFDSRPYAFIEDMNEAIVKGCNSVVGSDDDLYILGDVAMKAGKAIECLSRLNGRKHLILGNHDNEQVLRDSKLLVEIVPYKRITLTGLDESVYERGQLPICMCHYPMMSWDRQLYGSVHVYGHIHTQQLSYFDNDGRHFIQGCQIPNAYNCFCGFQNYVPMTIFQLMEKYGYYPDIYKFQD